MLYLLSIPNPAQMKELRLKIPAGSHVFVLMEECRNAAERGKIFNQ